MKPISVSFVLCVQNSQEMGNINQTRWQTLFLSFQMHFPEHGIVTVWPNSSILHWLPVERSLNNLLLLHLGNLKMNHSKLHLIYHGCVWTRTGSPSLENRRIGYQSLWPGSASYGDKAPKTFTADLDTEIMNLNGPRAMDHESTAHKSS